jgi:hypothetical protein
MTLTFTRIRTSQLTFSSPYCFEIDPIQVKHVMRFILDTGDHMTFMFTRIRISQLTSSSPYCFEIDPIQVNHVM